MIKRKKNFVVQATTAAVVSMALVTACKHSSPTQGTAFSSDVTTAARTPYTAESEGQALTQKVSQEANASYVVELEFEKGTDRLSDAARERLSNLMNTARAAGRVDEVKVLTWADQEYPSTAQKKLSSAQRDLANRRNDHVEKYIDSMGWKVDVDTYNMAKQPNVFSKWFNTSDARLKRSLVSAGLPTTADGLQYPSKASHSIVMVLLK